MDTKYNKYYYKYQKYKDKYSNLTNLTNPSNNRKNFKLQKYKNDMKKIYKIAEDVKILPRNFCTHFEVIDRSLLLRNLTSKYYYNYRRISEGHNYMNRSCNIAEFIFKLKYI